MQYANIMLALGGDAGTTVPKTEVSASEIAVLRLIHGSDAVFDVEPVQVSDEKAKRTSREEIRRLTELYGRARVHGPDGNDVSVINVLFPGAGAQAIKDIDDLEIPHEFFKAKSRVTAAVVEKEVDAGDGLDKMTKSDLLNEAEKRGIEASSAMTKAEIIDAIRAGGEGTEDEVFA
jgi:hypothetical protein